MKKSIGAIYILVALVMFFSIRIVDILCIAISNSNNFVKYSGSLLAIPIITLLIGVYCLFGEKINKWIKSFDLSDKS